MSTLSTTSAVFNEVSGPHEGPGSYLPLWAPQAGLGQAETNYFMGPNTVLSSGPVVVHIGQTIPMTVFLNNGVRLTANTVADAEALRGRLEARAERNGLATKSLWIHQSGQHAIWTVTPQIAPMTEDQAKKVLRDAVLEELPASAAIGNTVVAFLSTLPVGRQTTWMQTPSQPWPTQVAGLGIVGPDWRMRRGIVGPDWRRAMRGLGDIFSDIARGATTVSADLVCSPAFQAVAAQDIARRYGEEHARTFREAFRQATAFCSPGAAARAAARQQETERRNAMLVGLGVVGVAVALLGVWHFTKKRANGRRRRRNGSQDVIRSMVGRRVSAYGLGDGTVERWEPYSAGMTDTLVAFDSGKQVWVGSRELRPVDGRGGLPDRYDVREMMDAEAERQLEQIRDDHIRDFRQPWPGAEHGKAIVGQAVTGALSDVKARRPRRRNRRAR